MDLKRRIAIRLKAVRNSRQLTQNELAERTGRSVDAISNLERAKGLPSLETLEALATVLEIPIEEFFAKTSGGRRENAGRVTLLARLSDLGRTLTDRDLKVAVKVLEAFHDPGSEA
jgi:transcriptional regulator with XRE-family HTH domain